MQSLLPTVLQHGLWVARKATVLAGWDMCWLSWRAPAYLGWEGKELWWAGKKEVLGVREQGQN